MKEFQINKQKYGNQTILESHMVSFNDTGIHIISGENGSGKTSFVKNLLKNYHEDISLMLQDNFLIEELSVIQNLAMNSVTEDCVLAFLRLYDLTHLIERDINKMSGGEKRLILLARVALSPRPVLVFDEPSNDLDYRNMETGINIIKDCAKKNCVIVITHDRRLKNLGNAFYEIIDNRLVEKEQLGQPVAVKVKGTQICNGVILSFYPLKSQYQNRLILFASAMLLLWGISGLKLSIYNERLPNSLLYVATWESRTSDDLFKVSVK